MSQVFQQNTPAEYIHQYCSQETKTNHYCSINIGMEIQKYNDFPKVSGLLSLKSVIISKSSSEAMMGVYLTDT